FRMLQSARPREGKIRRVGQQVFLLGCQGFAASSSAPGDQNRRTSGTHGPLAKKDERKVRLRLFAIRTEIILAEIAALQRRRHAGAFASTAAVAAITPSTAASRSAWVMTCGGNFPIASWRASRALVKSATVFIRNSSVVSSAATRGSRVLTVVSKAVLVRV